MLMLESLVLLTVVAVFSYYISHRYRKRKFYQLAEKLPGHNRPSLLESLWILSTLSRNQYITKLLSFIQEDFILTKFWLMSKLLIITKDADVIHEVFNSAGAYNKPKIFYQSFITTNALIALNGRVHRNRRKFLSRAFSPKMLERLPQNFEEQSVDILDIMKAEIGNGQFDVMKYIGGYTLASFSKSNLNYEMNFYKSEIYEAYEAQSIVMMNLLPFLMMGFSSKLLSGTKIGQEYSKVHKTLYKFANGALEFNKETKNKEELLENTIGKIYMNPNNKISIRDAEDDLVVMIFGAYETTAKTISTALMMLGMYPEYQQKLIDEMQEILGSDFNQKLDQMTLSKFTFLDVVIKETMRLFPVAPIVVREATTDIKICGYILPKDSIIIIPIYALHRNEKYWGSDANLFKPERFFNRLKNPHAFAPFTGGKRMCIGYRYAMLSIKIFIINFLKTYKVNCSTKLEELKIDLTVTINILNGYKISIEKR